MLHLIFFTEGDIPEPRIISWSLILIIQDSLKPSSPFWLGDNTTKTSRMPPKSDKGQETLVVYIR